MRGLEREANVELIHYMSQNLGMLDDGLAWTKGERIASGVVFGAEQINKPLVDDLLRADVVKTDGRIKAEQWKYLQETYGLEGPRRTPGEILKELDAKTQNLELTDARPQPFRITSEWQEVPDGMPMPPGMEYRMDMQTGKNFVRDPKAPATSGGSGEILNSEFRIQNEPSPKAVADWEAVAKRDRVAEQMGNADPPVVIDLLTAHEKRTVAALKAARDGIVGKWDGPITALPSEVKAAVQAEAKALGAQLFEARTRTVAEAEARANFAMLDYGQKRNIDTLLGAVAPYYYWGSRQGRNFAIRMAERPGIALTYLKYRKAMEDENTQRGYRQRFEGGLEVKLPLVASKAIGMPEGTSLFVALGQQLCKLLRRGSPARSHPCHFLLPLPRLHLIRAGCGAACACAGLCHARFV